MTISRKSLYVIVAVLIAVGAGAVLVYRTPPTSMSSMPTALFGGVSLTIELATTTTARERGLGGRTNVPMDYGMLFVFREDDRYGFWMKDTLVPLDIFWLDAKGRVVSTAEGVQPESYPHVFYPSGPAHYVLETAAGFARIHAIATGTSLYLQNWPTVSE